MQSPEIVNPSGITKTVTVTGVQSLTSSSANTIPSSVKRQGSQSSKDNPSAGKSTSESTPQAVSSFSLASRSTPSVSGLQTKSQWAGTIATQGTSTTITNNYNIIVYKTVIYRDSERLPQLDCHQLIQLEHYQLLLEQK